MLLINRIQNGLLYLQLYHDSKLACINNHNAVCLSVCPSYCIIFYLVCLSVFFYHFLISLSIYLSVCRYNLSQSVCLSISIHPILSVSLSILSNPIPSCIVCLSVCLPQSVLSSLCVCYVLQRARSDISGDFERAVHGHVSGFSNISTVYEERIDQCESMIWLLRCGCVFVCVFVNILVLCLWRAELEATCAKVLPVLWSGLRDSSEHLEKIFPVLPPLGQNGRGDQTASERPTCSFIQPFHGSDL